MLRLIKDYLCALIKMTSEQASGGDGTSVPVEDARRDVEEHRPGYRDNGPPRKMKLSKFDSQSLRNAWQTQEEQQAAEATVQKMAAAFSTILQCVGDPNPDREGLQRTPLRAARALCFFTKGYEEDIHSKFLPAPPTRLAKGVASQD